MHRNVAAQRATELARDRQAQAGAAIATRDRVVALHERFEDLLELCGTNADARVDNNDAQHHAMLIERRALGTQLHRTAVGELDGVGDEIGQNLSQASGIAHRPTKVAEPDLRSKQQAFVAGQCAIQTDHLIDLPRHHKRYGLALHHARFGAREIENAVEHIEQRQPRRVGDAQLFALLVGEIAGLHRLQYAQDAVERRAYFMTDFGEELRLRAAGGLSLLLGLRQLRLALGQRTDPRLHFACHVAKVLGQHANLIAPAARQLDVVVAGADRLTRPGQPFERSREQHAQADEHQRKHQCGGNRHAHADAEQRARRAIERGCGHAIAQRSQFLAGKLDRMSIVVARCAIGADRCFTAAGLRHRLVGLPARGRDDRTGAVEYDQVDQTVAALHLGQDLLQRRIVALDQRRSERGGEHRLQLPSVRIEFALHVAGDPAGVDEGLRTQRER